MASTRQARTRRNAPLITLAIVLFYSGTSTRTLAEDVSIVGSLYNDMIHRGVSLSAQEAGAHLSFDQNLDNNFFIGGDFFFHRKSSQNNRKGRVALYVGYFHQLSENSSASYSLTHYHFDADFLVDWNYTEVTFDYQYIDTLSFGFSYADSYYGRDHASYYAEVNWQPKLGNELYALLSAGVTKTPGLSGVDMLNDYSIALSQNFGNLNINLGYFYVDDEAKLVHFKGNAGSRFGLEMSYVIY